MIKELKLSELVGKPLQGFMFVEMTEVYRVNEDGTRIESVGVFKNPDIATAFAGVQTDANWHKTGKVIVLSNGESGLVISQATSAKIFNDEEEVLNLRKKVLAKLSPAERKLLGFNS